MLNFAEKLYQSFDKSTKEQTLETKLYKSSEVKHLSALNRSLCCLGSGFSYVGAYFSSQSVTINPQLLNRIIDFCPNEGIATVEAGTTLWALHSFAFQHGFYLPCQPGHGLISVGGCVAANVHGKNHARDGTFKNFVKSLEIFHPKYGKIHADRQKNSEIFWLTCGGFGLTGLITKVTLQLKPIQNYFYLKSCVFGKGYLSHIQNLFNRDESDFIYGWIHPGLKDDRWIIFDHSAVTESGKTYTINDKHNLSNPRSSNNFKIWNRFSVATASEVFLGHHRLFPSSTIDLTSALFPIHGKESYFRMFGRQGFHEIQVLVKPNLANALINEIKDQAKQYGVLITLISTKVFDEPAHLISFTGRGLCLSFNFVRNDKFITFYNVIRKIMISYNTKPNLIKDSALDKQLVQAGYSQFDEFKSRLKKYDSKRIFRSELSERIGL